MTPDPMRATAERLAREVVKNANADEFRPWTAWEDMHPVAQQQFVDLALAGLTHRDRTAEREAAEKAFTAGWVAWSQALGKYSDRYTHETARDRYLAAEFDAGERVTLSNGEAVRFDGKVRYRGLTWDTIAGFLQRDNERGYVLTDAEIAALYRLAEQRGAER